MESRSEKDVPLVEEKEIPPWEALRRAGEERRLAKAKLRALVRRRRGTQPSAREWFTILRPMLLNSRPVFGKTEWGDPIYGAPTFRNVIDPETGEHL